MLRNLLLLCFSLVFLAACDRDRHDGMYDYLKGNWNLVQVGLDANGNEHMDAGEMISLPDSSLLTTVFHADGTGSGSINYSNYSLSMHFSWRANDRAQILSIYTPDSNFFEASFIGHDYHSFALLSSADVLGGAKAWMVYRRAR